MSNWCLHTEYRVLYLMNPAAEIDHFPCQNLLNEKMFKVILFVGILLEWRTNFAKENNFGKISLDIPKILDHSTQVKDDFENWFNMT